MTTLATEPEIETRHTIWAHYPLQVRKDTSDPDVFGQVFIDREYAMLDDLKDVRFVVDCGAYVGYSAAYFLSRWPGCRLIAFEADWDNCRQLIRNVINYYDAVWNRCAIWSHGDGVKLSGTRYRDGREWAIHVQDCEPGEEPTTPSTDMSWLFAYPRVDLLKMDIEGAEAVVFSAPDLSWIDRVDNLVIETHDDSCFGPGVSKLVADVMTQRGFNGSHHGELTMYRKGEPSA